jgi:hypothetical protein
VYRVVAPPPDKPPRPSQLLSILALFKVNGPII